ncbi:hypothetical protein C8Q80DRAFT_1276120 [Daedaleopsis nitida]|nr:hypothetical protein C8Q80DRAFT_1276120 [Daedaleopsis nitida]
MALVPNAIVTPRGALELLTGDLDSARWVNVVCVHVPGPPQDSPIANGPVRCEYLFHVVMSVFETSPLSLEGQLTAASGHPVRDGSGPGRGGASSALFRHVLLRRVSIRVSHVRLELAPVCWGAREAGHAWTWMRCWTYRWWCCSSGAYLTLAAATQTANGNKPTGKALAKEMWFHLSLIRGSLLVDLIRHLVMTLAHS